MGPLPKAAAWLLVFVLALPVALAGAYLLLAMLLGAIPLNWNFADARDGIAVYVRTNGVHAELVVPTQRLIDWSADFPATDMRALERPAPWVSFGWGDRGFLLNTPTWADLRASTALLALSGLGRGAMHVEYLEEPPSQGARRVVLSRAQFERLVNFIRASFELVDERPVRIATGYGDTDAFYEALPVYTPWHTCNEWARRALSEAGVRVPVWAPFDTALFLHLPVSAK
jgi:uncharacterized protein (TIGR02117 family)